jgi:hypothetical protein
MKKDDDKKMFGTPDSWNMRVPEWLNKLAKEEYVDFSKVPLDELGAVKDKAIELGLYDSSKVEAGIPYNPKSNYSKKYHKDYGEWNTKRRIKKRIEQNIKNGRAPYQDFSTSDIVIAESLSKAQKKLAFLTGKKPVQLELPLDNPNITEGNENE